MNEYVDNEARKARLVGKTVTMAHGAGGRQTSELIDMIFKAHFDNPDLTADDAAVLTPPIGKMAVSTDGFIVSPAFFPGGNIGKLSICGTVNDLSCMGAKPLYLTCAFVIEEGFPMEKQEEIAEKVFKSRSVITNALRLLKLDEAVQLMLMEGKITNGHAKAILRLEDKEEQRAVAQKVVEEQLSVRDTEKYIKSLLDKKNEPAVTKPVLKNQTLYETLESRMKSRMGTKVQIKRKSDDKGKIEIDYYSNDDLERIIELMGITKDTIE